VRYVADAVDRKWLSNYLVFSMKGAIGGTQHGGKFLGKAGGGGSSSPLAVGTSGGDLTLVGVEDIFTLLELAAFHHPELPIERVDVATGSLLGGGVGTLCIPKSVVEDVKKFWVERRVSTGTRMPLIAHLRRPVDESRQEKFCHRDVLGELPLPFCARDWTVPTTVRTLVGPSTSSQTEGGTS
jgi:hypothetical protein